MLCIMHCSLHWVSCALSAQGFVLRVTLSNSESSLHAGKHRVTYQGSGDRANTESKKLYGSTEAVQWAEFTQP